jgi:hypothetical protein
MDHRLLVACLMRRIALLGFLVTMGSTPGLEAATYDVGAGQAFATIQECVNTIVAGDTCLVHAGTYRENISFPDSNAMSFDQFVVRNNPGDVVTVISSTSPVLSWNGRDGWTVDGINMTYSGSQGSPRVIQNASCHTANYSTIKNSILKIEGGTSSDGSVLEFYCSDRTVVSNVTLLVGALSGSTTGVNGCNFLKSSHLAFTGSTISGVASEAAGKLKDGCVFSGTDIVVTDNVVRDGWAFDLHPDGLVLQGDGDRAGQQTSNVTIARNLVVNFSGGIFVDAIHKPISGVNCVCNNVVVEEDNFRYGGLANKMNGIVISGFNINGGGWPVSVNVYNNTVVSRQMQFSIGWITAGSAVSAKNNLFVEPQYGSVQGSSLGVMLDFNYYSGGVTSPIRWDGTVYSLGSLQTVVGVERNGKTGVADLLSTFEPKSTSETRLRGLNLSASFTTDFANNPRPSTGPWDIGAYQYVESTATPPSNLRLSF